MKNIGILNFHFEMKNYGAVLQAAALQYFLRKHGFTPKNIDFQPDGSFGQPVLDRLRNLKLMLMRMGKLVTVNSTRKIHNGAFDSFSEKWIDVTSERCSHVSQLEEDNFDFAAYIVGSDQVWRNTYTGRAIEAYFFSFVKSHDTKRIAYAASFGVDHWEFSLEHRKTLQVAELVKKFDLISVREKSGIDICKDIFGVHADLAIDPTLLAGKEFFDEVAKDSKFVPDFNYIAVYKLDQDIEFLNYLHSVKNKTGYKVLDIYKRETDSGDHLSLVEDWVAMIRDARLVATDSFHCCCLAAIYRKPFIYFPPKHNRGMTRIYNLFELLSLNTVGAIKPKLSELNQKFFLPNYKVTNALMKRLRDQSSALLLNALEK